MGSGTRRRPLQSAARSRACLLGSSQLATHLTTHTHIHTNSGQIHPATTRRLPPPPATNPLAELRAVLLLREGVVVRVVVLGGLVPQHVEGLAVPAPHTHEGQHARRGPGVEQEAAALAGPHPAVASRPGQGAARFFEGATDRRQQPTAAVAHAAQAAHTRASSLSGLLRHARQPAPAGKQALTLPGSW